MLDRYADHFTALFLVVFGVLVAGDAGHGVELQAAIVGAGIAILTRGETRRRDT